MCRITQDTGGGNFTPPLDMKRCKKYLDIGGLMLYVELVSCIVPGAFNDSLLTVFHVVIVPKCIFDVTAVN